MPFESPMYNLSKKYDSIDRNLFSNPYQQKHLSRVPQYKNQLNLNKKPIQINEADGSCSLNYLFNIETTKNQFFKSAKKSNINSPLRKYFDDGMIKPPIFDQNTFYLGLENVNSIQGKALANYFQNSPKIHRLVIDQCLMKDEIFGQIL